MWVGHFVLFGFHTLDCLHYMIVLMLVSSALIFWTAAIILREEESRIRLSLATVVFITSWTCSRPASTTKQTAKGKWK